MHHPKNALTRAPFRVKGNSQGIDNHFPCIFSLANTDIVPSQFKDFVCPTTRLFKQVDKALEQKAVAFGHLSRIIIRPFINSV